MAALKLNGLSDGVMAAGALLIGGAAFYLYFRGARGAAKDAVSAAGNVVAGVADGVVSLGVSAGKATGQAFKDVSQATFESAKEKTGNCDFGSTQSVFAIASASCVFRKYLSGIIGGSPEPVTASDAQTAPGGGLWSPTKSTFSSVFTGPNDGTSWPTFENPVPDALPGVVPSGFLPVDWGNDYAPGQPVIIGSAKPVNEYGATSLFSVAGMRG